MLPGRDFVLWNGPVLDMIGHGTHLAGTVLQETDNGVGLAGIAFRGRLTPLKAGYAYCEVQIVQSELGIPGLVDPSERGTCPDSAVSQAIRYAAGRGVFVAISNGNQYGRGNPVEYPAAYAPDLEGAVSVGAVGRSGRRAYYSATGAHVELAAPGGDSRDGGLAGVLYQVGLDTRQRTRRGQQPGLPAGQQQQLAGSGFQRALARTRQSPSPVRRPAVGAPLTTRAASDRTR